MYNLFYTSSATHLPTPSELDELLLKAREKNKLDNITGLLLYCEGTFVQLLEGDEYKVKSTFDRISKDPRHTDINNVVSAFADSRYYPSWQMGFKAMSPEELATIEKHNNTDIKNYFKTSKPYKLIKLMSLNHWTH